MYQPKLNSMQKRQLLYALAVLLWVAAIGLCLKRNSYNTVFAVNISTVIVLLLVVRLLGRLPLDKLSYFILFPLTVMIYLQYHTSFLTEILFTVGLGAVLKLQIGYVRSYFINLSIIELAAALVMYSYEVAFKYCSGFYYDIGRKYNLSPVTKAVIILLAGFLLLSVLLLLARLLGNALKRKRKVFQRIAEMSAGIEIFWFLLVSLSGLSVSFYKLYLNIHDFYIVGISRIVEYGWLFLLCSDVAFICLLIHAVSVKQKMSLLENEKNLISAYSEDLESSLDHMREIRHDVKNLFLTMGGFVEESGSEEMKKFYRQSIVPFMEDTIIKNELYDKLKVLQDEPLKSFFCYKLTEKIGCGVHILLDIRSPVFVGRGYGDIVRILGILIDNAAEESIQTPEKMVNIHISGSMDRSRTNIRISNSVRDEIRERGVMEGVTDKGLGRGNGLLIVKRILSQYDNLLLNSYFAEEGFVQNLEIFSE